MLLSGTYKSQLQVNPAKQVVMESEKRLTPGEIDKIVGKHPKAECMLCGQIQKMVIEEKMREAKEINDQEMIHQIRYLLRRRPWEALDLIFSAIGDHRLEEERDRYERKT